MSRPEAEDRQAAPDTALIQQHGLSARAWGVYCHLLACPDGTTVTAMVEQFAEGRDALTTAVTELTAAGLVHTRRHLDGNLTRTRIVAGPEVGQ